MKKYTAPAYKKEYYENNKEVRLKQVKEYREKHKDEIKVKLNEKIECECGGRYTLYNKKTHMKSKKHIKYEELLLEKS